MRRHAANVVYAGSSPAGCSIFRPVVQTDRAALSESANRGSTPRGPARDRVPDTRKFSRESPNGEAPGCLPGSGGFESRLARHFYSRGCRPAAGSPILSRQTRVQLSPALPWGYRPVARICDFQSQDADSTSAAPTSFPGSKLCRRSTRLLSEKAEFDSPGTHQLLAVITTVVRRTVNAYYVGSNPMPPANFVYAGVVVW